MIPKVVASEMGVAQTIARWGCRTARRTEGASGKVWESLPKKVIVLYTKAREGIAGS